MIEESISSERVISHHLGEEALPEAMARIKKRIIDRGPLHGATVEKQLALVDELSEFKLGRFLLQSHGLNGFWNHYVATYPFSDVDPETQLEKRMLERYPVTLATQRRFEIFREVFQQQLRDGMVLASVPCGVMSDLLTLDYSQVQDVRLVGIDIDSSSLEQAQALAEKKGLSDCVELLCGDAWDLSSEYRGGFDLLTSNGLTFYEMDDEKVTALYRQFYDALKPGGMLVTSFLTPSPKPGTETEWIMDVIDPDDLIEQTLVLREIIPARWQAHRTSTLTDLQLRQAGFVDIQFCYDEAHIFPTVVAIKS